MILSRLVLYWCLLIILTSCSRECEQGQRVDNDEIIPTTTFVPEVISSFTPQRVVDLSKLVIALEKYKRDNREYPISSDFGEQWNRLYSESGGQANENWIIGLVPAYLEVLPRDPRLDNVYQHQYMYKSNGAHYKLLAPLPDDCSLIKSSNRKLIDFRRGCDAYGFWTHGAMKW